MSFEEYNGEFTWSCDECGASASYVDKIDFRSAWGELKGQGWTASKSRDGDWSHYCRDCDSKRPSAEAILDQRGRDEEAT